MLDYVSDQESLTRSITLPITQAMLDIAEGFSAGLPSAEKREQIIDNTLAVSVVNLYLKMMEFETDLQASDCWHPLLRGYSDVADLVLPDIGHLECRWISSESQHTKLPMELPDNRIGLVMVELDKPNHQARLLGFTPKAEPGGTISRDALQSLDDILQYLERFEVKVVDLQQWFEGLFVAGWQSAKALVGDQRYTLAQGFMSEPIQLAIPTTGAKLIELNLSMGTQSVVLLLGLSPLAEENVEIRVQLHPTSGEQHLPSNLKLELLSDSGESLRTVDSRQLDNLIQLPRVQCQTGEKFGIRISKDEVSVTEFFMI